MQKDTLAKRIQDATYLATFAATYLATHYATRDATFRATYHATDDATYDLVEYAVASTQERLSKCRNTR